MSEGVPAMDGFSMPAEWAPHARCWMAWPCRLEVWGDRFEVACLAYAAVARAIAAFEPVSMLTPSRFVSRARLQLGPKVEVVKAEIDDSWTRDTGPTFLADGKGGVAGVAWRFNAWGNKYHPYDADAKLGRWLLERLGMRRYDGPMVMEGGAVHVDGAGTLITTGDVLLNENRNPTLDRRQVEERLALYLGARKIIWLQRGLAGDETDGHVDNVARFVAPGRVLCAASDDPLDPDHDMLQEVRDQLARETDAQGRPLEVVELPQPWLRRQKVPVTTASYINFYIANGGVIVPAFDDPMDERACAIIAAQFPDRKVVQLPARDIVHGGGGIHCITLQQPAGTPIR